MCVGGAQRPIAVCVCGAHRECVWGTAPHSGVCGERQHIVCVCVGHIESVCGAQRPIAVCVCGERRHTVCVWGTAPHSGVCVGHIESVGNGTLCVWGTDGAP